jgi:predicted ArsR family transcriptional regulator
MKSVSLDSLESFLALLSGTFVDSTRRDIYFYAKSKQATDVNEVAKVFSLHPNVARHHLEKLKESGYLEVTLKKKESAGRPAKVYKATGKELGVPGQKELLMLLAGRALSQIDDADKLAEEVGREFARDLVARLHKEPGSLSIDEAMQRITQSLNLQGFNSLSKQAEGSTAIVSSICPFGDAKQVSPIFCALEKGLVDEMLKILTATTTQIKFSSKAKGDNECKTVA